MMFPKFTLLLLLQAAVGSLNSCFALVTPLGIRALNDGALGVRQTASVELVGVEPSKILVVITALIYVPLLIR
jgi:hypothetical protein